MTKLGQYMLQESEEWQATKEKAYRNNAWFLPEFIDLSVHNIASEFLQETQLENWINQYPELNEDQLQSLTIGIVMAGNIPLVGFHDFLCVFMSGAKSLIKPSSKDEVLIKHLVGKLKEWDSEAEDLIAFADLLKNCDGYIATGSNSSAGYFDYYFGRYPNIIRRNRSSVAILNGKETNEDLERLADDVYLYYGMGCRNITKIFVPENYDFVPLINVFKKYDYLADHHKYKNNYDYNLALHILNNKQYMSNASLLLVEDSNIFSPVSQLNYEIYTSPPLVMVSLKNNEAVQCIVGQGYLPFGQAQKPGLIDYADGVDIMKWLAGLKK